MEGELSAVVVHAAAVHQAQDVLHGGAVQHLHTTAVSSDQVMCRIEFRAANDPLVVTITEKAY